MPLSPWRHGQFTQPRAPTDPFFEACCVRTLAGAPHDALDVLGRDTRTSPHLFAQLALPVFRIAGGGLCAASAVGFQQEALGSLQTRFEHASPRQPLRSSRKPLTLSAEGFARPLKVDGKMRVGR